MKQFDEHGSNLIFLISQPGPEASMLQRLLSRHPSVYSVPESWIMLHPLYALKRRGLETEFDAHRARSALDSFLSLLPNFSKDVMYGSETVVTLYLSTFCVGIGIGSMLF